MNIKLLSNKKIKINNSVYDCILEKNKIYDSHNVSSETDNKIFHISNEPKVIAIKNVIKNIKIPLEKISNLLENNIYMIEDKKYYMSYEGTKDGYNISFIEF